MQVTIILIVIGAFGTVTKGLLNDSIIENGQNIKKSPEGLRKLAVTQTPVENHQLALM